MIKSRRMRLTRHVARKGKEKQKDNAYRVLVRNAESDHYENLDVQEKII
jgi:hypothetical protein